MHTLCDTINIRLEVLFMGTVNMSIRMDSELKKQAEVMLSDMGLNMTTA